MPFSYFWHSDSCDRQRQPLFEVPGVRTEAEKKRYRLTAVQRHKSTHHLHLQNLNRASQTPFSLQVHQNQKAENIARTLCVKRCQKFQHDFIR
ncbi:uncharacterized protein LOC117895387 isoform X2 [Drosophila subobscura]|uniref:uncharacterized protein LOC117895387 isoform X2 n=1 Tax=Drosophila subobscura TaxID=7241 RepID=UPI00155AD3C8|nr:uncharacterized protein LOC117895387 isoform X2 [Drosophila subobscura]